MRKRITILCLLILNIIQLYSQEQPYDTDNNGFINISTLSHLRWLSENPEGWNDNYELDNDINAAATNEWNDGKGFSPIGNSEINFRGNFKHNGFVIDSLSINRPDETSIGFFGCLNVANIEMKLSNCSIAGKDTVGGLIGRNIEATHINNSFVSGTISGNEITGGLVGYNRGRITNTDASGLINGYNKTGGFIGLDHSSVGINNCSFTGQVNGEYNTGGFVGFGSYNILNSYSNGIVIGKNHVSGFIGYNKSTGIIRNCYSNCLIEGESNIGGFISFSKLTIINSYSTGQISGSEEIGGFINKNEGTITNCFWNEETSGIDISDGATALNESEIKSKNTFSDEGWNFDFIWKIDTGYPYIEIDFSYRPIDENNNGFVDISSLDNLRWLSESGFDYDMDIEFTNDINAADTYNWNGGRGFLPIGTTNNGFAGNIYGNECVIDSLYINRPENSNIGLFTNLSNYDGVLRDLNLKNCEIIGNYNTGGILGVLSKYNKIINSSVNGNIDGFSSVGGLIGGGSISSIISCYFEGSISGNQNVGGLIGKLYDAVVQDCYTLSFVEGHEESQNIGGLIGSIDQGTIITRSYSASEVYGKKNVGGLIGENYNSDVSESFWDKELSGLSSSAGGLGLSTSEMKTMETFADYNWDFENVWDIQDSINQGYPFLKTLNIKDLTEEPIDLNNNGYRNIKSLKHLRWISVYPNAWTENYELDNDIDASETKEWNNGMGWNPIGDNNMYLNPEFGFSGEFNGKGNSIKNLYINRREQRNIGFFASLTKDAIVYNLKIENADISGKEIVGILSGSLHNDNGKELILIEDVLTEGRISESEISGGLIGFINSYNKVIIENSISDVVMNGVNSSGGLIGFIRNNSDTLIINNCNTFGSISGSKINGSDRLGGLIGQNYSMNDNALTIIKNCSSIVNIDGWTYVGGFIGINATEGGAVSIDNSKSEGNIIGLHYVGGMIGFNRTRTGNVSINECISNNNIIEGESSVGGFIGFNVTDYGKIEISKSISADKVSGEEKIGGFIGQIELISGMSKILNCYSRGNVSGNTIVGGFCGENNTSGAGAVSIIENCYSTGKVESNISKGGFCGLQISKGKSEINYCYWDLETSDTDISDGGEGRLTSNMKIQQTFKYWDFDNIWNITPGINDGYPHLQGMPTSVNSLDFANETEYKIYPNPVNDYLKIDRIKKGNSISELIIYDLSGNKIYQDRIANEQTIDLSNLNSGFYILKIDNSVFKFIKK